MKALFAILIALSLVLVGCGHTEDEPAPLLCNDGTEVASLDDCPSEEVLPEDTPGEDTGQGDSYLDDMGGASDGAGDGAGDEPEGEDTAPGDTTTSIPEEIQTLFDKAKTNTVSMKYQFKGPKDPLDFYDVFVYGDDIKVLLPSDR